MKRREVLAGKPVDEDLGASSWLPAQTLKLQTPRPALDIDQHNVRRPG